MAGGRNWWTVVGLLSLLVASACTADGKRSNSVWCVGLELGLSWNLGYWVTNFE